MSDDHHSAVPVGIPQYSSFEQMYSEVQAQIESVLAGHDPLTPQIAENDWRLFSRLNTSLANISSLLFYAMNAQHHTSTKRNNGDDDDDDAKLHSLPINWVGFYLLETPDRLALSAFQGKLACQHIKLGRGMCGIAMLQGKDLAIEDVQADPAHIACDAASQSEAVVVLRDGNRRAVGVLDIDSSVKGRFTAEKDIAALRKVCDTITKHHEAELAALFRGAMNINNKKANLSPSCASSPAAAGVADSSQQMSLATNTAAIPPRIFSTTATTTTTAAAHPGATDEVAKMPRTNFIGKGFGGAALPSVVRPAAAQQQRQQQQQATVATTRITHHCSSGGNNSSNSRAEQSDLKRHKNWELRYRTLDEMLNSAALSKLEERYDVKMLPEIIFDSNEIHFVHDEGGGVGSMKFRVCAQSSLANAVQHYSTPEFREAADRDALLPKGSAAWAKQREEYATFDPKIDWAFRNTYRGVWSDSAGNMVEPQLVSDAEAEREPDLLIDYDMLRLTDVPILFFAAMDLWEDDLHDAGLSKISAKARVMDACFFVLVRHVLRVDGVKLQVRDTRHFHKFGSKRIVVEESLKSVDIAQFLKENAHVSAEEFHRTMMNSPVEQLDMLKQEWKKNMIIPLP